MKNFKGLHTLDFVVKKNALHELNLRVYIELESSVGRIHKFIPHVCDLRVAISGNSNVRVNY